MEWNAQLDIDDGVTDPDPRATPALVPPARIFHIPDRDSRGNANTRMIVGLDAPTGDDTQFAVWGLDSRDEEAAPVDRRWYLIFLFFKMGLLSGGHYIQSRLGTQSEAFAGGGTFYFQAIAPNLTAATRRIIIRATG